MTKTALLSMRTRLIAAVVAGLMAVLCAGCGVRPSKVITGGPAPSGPAEGAALYFVSHNSLSPVLRATGQRLSPEQTLDLLANGPNATERASGFTSQVPAEATVQTITVNSGEVTVMLSTDVATLSTVAVDQILCTLRHAMMLSARVTLVGNGHSRGPGTCPFPGARPPSVQ